MNFNVGVDINHFKEHSLNLCGTSCAKHKTYCKCIVFPSSSLSRNLQHLSRRQEGLEQIYEICSKAGLNGFMESSQFHQSLLNFQGSLSHAHYHRSTIYLPKAPMCFRPPCLVLLNIYSWLKFQAISGFIGVFLISSPSHSSCKLELWNRILKSLIKVGCPLSDFPILSDFLTGRKPLLLWSF